MAESQLGGLSSGGTESNESFAAKAEAFAQSDQGKAVIGAAEKQFGFGAASTGTAAAAPAEGAAAAPAAESDASGFAAQASAFASSAQGKEAIEEAKNIPTAINTIRTIGTSSGLFQPTFSEDPSLFTTTGLAGFDAIAFLSNSNVVDSAGAVTQDVLDAEGVEALREWLTVAGHGLVGLHAATACLFEDESFGVGMGSWFDYHPTIQNATFLKLISHPTIDMLPDRYNTYEEVYNFRTDPRSVNATVLLTKLNLLDLRRVVQDNLFRRNLNCCLTNGGKVKGAGAVQDELDDVAHDRHPPWRGWGARDVRTGGRSTDFKGQELSPGCTSFKWFKAGAVARVMLK
ncbi:hypothetical protein RQP46_001970 [Phenoliferia psychrophenolica]